MTLGLGWRGINSGIMHDHRLRVIPASFPGELFSGGCLGGGGENVHEGEE